MPMATDIWAECAEGTAIKFDISRQEQDNYAIQRYKKTIAASEVNMLLNLKTITAANAGVLTDGAAACVLTSGSYADANDLKPLARILAFADAALEPVDFSISPSYAVRKILSNANLDKDDIALWEINEPSSVVGLANIKILNLDPEKVNIHGGSVALGHPLA
ncbi:hypothetical protein JTE90_017857 [Oedothorax gibbosus]|uniref:Thiolase C-terminal domain-containing protein n=1 Tax=Oedothorax gibbosus TaxID=931172 RepID=A0AAV6V3C7_9ARAC|nr:hypothetical protein JTE90_017857 [Oedothorax gibbosus]